MSDNGAAALAKRLIECGNPHLHTEHEPAMTQEWSGAVRRIACTVERHLPDATAILGERGVFLPDGLDGLIAKVEALPNSVVQPLISRAAVLAILRGER